MALVPVPKGINPLTGTSDLHRHTPGRSSSSPPGPHTIISGSHTDTTGTPGAGDILIRNGSAQWQPLAPNALGTNKFLRTVSGGLPSYESVDWSDLVGTAPDVESFPTSLGAGEIAYSDGFTLVGDPLLVWDGTNLGIGKAIPVRTIDVEAAEAVLQLKTTTDLATNHCMTILDVKNASGALAQHRYKQDGTSYWSHGVDPNDSYKWKLGQDQNCDTNVRLSVTTTGYLGVNNDAPQGIIDIYNNSIDHYSIFRWGTEATNQGSALRFMVAAAGVAAAHTNLLADIRCLVSSTPPAALQSRIEFYVNKGDALTQMMVLSSALGLRVEDGISGAVAARIQAIGGSQDSFAGGTSSREFRVSSAGDLSRIRNVPYVWPAANAVGVLNNDGAGNLSWASAGISGSGAAGQVTFWTGASAVSGDNGLFWDNTQKCLCLGTTSGIANANMLFDGTEGWIAFNNAATVVPTGKDHLGGGSDLGLSVFFIRPVRQMMIALDYGNAYSDSFLKVIKNSSNLSAGSPRTLLTVAEDATVAAGDSNAGTLGALALSAAAGGAGYAVRMYAGGTPGSGVANRSIVENSVVGGTGLCHWAIKNGYLMWTPTATLAPASFSDGTIGEMIGPFYFGSATRLLVYECRGNHEFVLDTDDDTTDALFRITRNHHWTGGSNLYYWPASSWYGEVLFTVNEAGEVFTPAWKIRRKTITGAYTLDTWAVFYGTNDLLISVTTLGAALTVTLPAAAAANAGRVICIKDETGNAATYNISVSVGVDGGGGGPTMIINTAYGFQWLYSSGSGWFRC